MTISRRQFVQGAGVTGLGLLAGCGRLPWQAQAPTRVPRVGYVTAGSASVGTPLLRQAFRQGLQDLGYVEEQNLLVEDRYADGQADRLPEIMAELVHLPVDIIV